MKTNELARGARRLYYYELLPADLGGLIRFNLWEAKCSDLFVRAISVKIIRSNVFRVKGNCVGNTPLNKIPIGKEMEFIIGDPARVKGTATRIVEIGGYKYLEIRLVPGALYLYSRVILEKCQFLEVASFLQRLLLKPKPW